MNDAAAIERFIRATDAILGHIARHHADVYHRLPRPLLDDYFDTMREARAAVATTLTQVSLRQKIRRALDANTRAILTADSLYAYLRRHTDRDDCKVIADAYDTHRKIAVTTTQDALEALGAEASTEHAERIRARDAANALPPVESILRTRTLPNGFTFPVAHDATWPDPVEAEHGIDPGTRDGRAFPHFTMPDNVAVTSARATTSDGDEIQVTATRTADGGWLIAPAGTQPAPDTVRIPREHALALIGGALTLANDLVKRKHPRNAARYRDAAIALTEALALPPLADDPMEES